jgi:serine/threonine protein phosphatase PrpC
MKEKQSENKIISSYFISAATDIGRNSINDDTYAVVKNGKRLNRWNTYHETVSLTDDDILLLMVADGIGGMAAGKQCSQKCIESIVSNIAALHDIYDFKGWSKILLKAKEDVLAIFSKGAERGGTTLNILAIDAKKQYVSINVGDSVTMRLSPLKTDVLSDSQTLGAERQRRGDKNIPKREFSILMNFVGDEEGSPFEDAHVETGTIDEDSFFLATDGVLEEHSIPEITDLYQNAKLEAAALLWPYKNTSRDNVTAISAIQPAEQSSEMSELIYVYDGALGCLSDCADDLPDKNASAAARKSRQTLRRSELIQRLKQNKEAEAQVREILASRRKLQAKLPFLINEEEPAPKLRERKGYPRSKGN